MPLPDPPAKRRARPLGRVATVAALVFLVGTAAWLVGWATGAVARWFARPTPAPGLQAAREGPDDPAGLRERIARLEEARDRRPEDPAARLALADAYLAYAPHTQAGELFRQEAAHQADIAGALVDADRTGPSPRAGSAAYELALRRAGVLLRTGPEGERAALAVLEWLLEDASEPEGPRARLDRAAALNEAAYLLLTAEDASLRDPARARALAAECVKQHPAASAMPAFLDTLALALFETGDPEQALEVQTEALARADSGQLGIYLEHYDAFHKAVHPSGEQEPRAP